MSSGLRCKRILATVLGLYSLQLLHLQLFAGVCLGTTRYLILLSDIHLKVNDTELSHPPWEQI